MSRKEPFNSEESDIVIAELKSIGYTFEYLDGNRVAAVFPDGVKYIRYSFAAALQTVLRTIALQVNVADKVVELQSAHVNLIGAVNQMESLKK